MIEGLRGRLPASEKLAIIRLVEPLAPPAQAYLDHAWHLQTDVLSLARYQHLGEVGLEGRRSGPSRAWKRLPDTVREQVIDLALEQPELSPRELAVTFIDTRGYFISEASVYRLMKAQDFFTTPACRVMTAADEFTDKITAVNQLWQTDFTYLKVIGWGRFYLSTILDDYSHYVIAWKLCTTMEARDVTDTRTRGLDRRPRHGPHSRRAVAPDDAGMVKKR